MIGEAPGYDVRRIGEDPEALDAFYRGHIEAVLRFVTRRVSDPYRAADLTAEVFLAAIDSAGSFRVGRADPAAWLYGVARNVVAGDRRRNAREVRAYGRIAGRALVEEDDIACIVERIVAAEQSRRLYAAVETLPDGDRAVLELVALDGLSLVESSQALGISRVAARVRLHRARKAMQRKLAPGNERQLSEEVVS